MNAKEISDLFPSGARGEQEAVSYLEKEELYKMLADIAKSQGDRIQPKYRDLARLHHIVLHRKSFSVVEFGVGFSTLVFADALHKNEKKWLALSSKPEIRDFTSFRLHSVDTGSQWINATDSILPDHLKDRVIYYDSPVNIGLFNDRICHYYEKLPDVIPDFLYIDGPDPAAVLGDVNGLSWNNSNRIVMSADLLTMEPCLMPGCLVLIDGRTLNARFLSAHLFRNWSIRRNSDTDVTVMELKEMPLGKINHKTIEYQLGKHINTWLEPLNNN